MDIDCIQAQALLRFAGIGFNVFECNDPGVTPKGVLPIVYADNGLKMLHELRDLPGVSLLDESLSLSASQKADIVAFGSLVRDSIHPAVDLDRHCEENWRAVTRATLASHFPFPMSLVAPYMMRRQVDAQSQAFYPGCAVKDVEINVYKKAALAFDALEARLAAASNSTPSPFFFGDKPSTLDAVVFAAVACIQYAPMERRELRASLNTRPLLVAFCRNIMQNHFAPPGRIDASSVYVAQVDKLFDSFPDGAGTKTPGAPKSGSRPAEEKATKSPETLELEAEDAKLTNKFLFGCAALCTSYLLWHNLDKMGDLIDALDDE